MEKLGMAPRLGKSTDPSTVVLRALAVVIACMGALAGCLVGAGDDSLLSAMGDGGRMGDAGDARATDGPGGDVRAAEGGLDVATDAPRVDATVQDASSGGSPDATSLDTGAQNVADGGGIPIAAFSPAPIAFGFVGCGTAATQSLNVRNNGGGALGVSVTIKGLGSTPVFTVSPSILSLAHGQSAALTITATVPNTASAAAILAGSLIMFTTDPNNPNVSIPLSATSSGATVVVQQAQTGGTTGQAQAATFPATKVGTAAAPIDFWLVNKGNAPQTFTVGALTAGQISVDQIPAAGVTITLNQYESWKGTARFTPTGAAATTNATVSVVSGVTCESVPPLTTLVFTGAGTLGAVTDYPQNVDFPAPCGGNAPAPQTFSLRNTGSVPVVLGPPVLDSDAGFVVTTPTNTISPEGGTLTVTVTPPAFRPQTGDGGAEAGSMPAPITAMLTLPNDSTVPTIQVNLVEKPLGASLVFDTKAPVGADAGASFGQFVLPVAIATSSPPQTFGIINTGNSVANVTLSVTQTAAPDGGADAMAIAGAPSPFTLDNGAVVETVSVMPGGAEPPPTLTFTPAVAGDAWGQLSMTVDPNTVFCAQLPSPIALHGIGSGGGLSISTPSGTSVLTFPAPCDGKTVPAAQKFTVMNFGDKSLEWTMSAITGPGAAQYQVSAVDFTPKGSSTSTPLSTQAGVVQLLGPGDKASVTVSVPQKMPSANSGTFTAPSPASLAAQIVVTTNVPGANNSAVISLNEIPIGDQLFASLGPIDPTPVPLSSIVFGSASVGSPTPPSRTFVMTNSANPGSADARFSYVVTPATPMVYTITGTSLPAGHAATETITFTPAGNASYPATLKITQTDPTAPLCAPLPAPISLTGTGTQGLPVVSATTLVFGAVNCGTTGTAKTFTVTNNGGEAFNVTGLALDKDTPTTASPFTVTPTVPIVVAPGQPPPGQPQTITVTPKQIPQSLAQPGDVNDVNLFSDYLLVTTDAANAPAIPKIHLTMQAQGAIIVDSQPPLDPNWAFGTVTAPSTSAQIIRLIQNIGTLPASVSLAAVSPQVSPSVFGLATAPTPVPPATSPFNGVTSIVGQFTVPAGTQASSSWVGDETLTVTAAAFCEPLPAQWGGVDAGTGGVAIHLSASYALH